MDESKGYSHSGSASDNYYYLGGSTIENKKRGQSRRHGNRRTEQIISLRWEASEKRGFEKKKLRLKLVQEEMGTEFC